MAGTETLGQTGIDVADRLLQGSGRVGPGAYLRGMGIRRVVEDSSGNGGGSLPAYAAQVGIVCELCVSCNAGGAKVAQMEAHGAEVIEIKGRREYAALAAWAASAHGAFYASHVYNPCFMVGTGMVAYELWEQLGYRAPQSLVLPVGNGSLLLAACGGFVRPHQAGLIDRLPRLLAVQATACAPIYQAFHNGLETVEPVVCGATAATGIAVGQPRRGAQVLEAVRATRDAVPSVTEEEIEQARNELARLGFYVEETSAVAAAALAHLPADPQAAANGPRGVLLTGHGLKTYREPQPRTLPPAGKSSGTTRPSPTSKSGNKI